MKNPLRHLRGSVKIFVDLHGSSVCNASTLAFGIVPGGISKLVVMGRPGHGVSGDDKDPPIPCASDIETLDTQRNPNTVYHPGQRFHDIEIQLTNLSPPAKGLQICTKRVFLPWRRVTNTAVVEGIVGPDTIRLSDLLAKIADRFKGWHVQVWNGTCQTTETDPDRVFAQPDKPAVVHDMDEGQNIPAALSTDVGKLLESLSDFPNERSSYDGYKDAVIRILDGWTSTNNRALADTVRIFANLANATDETLYWSVVRILHTTLITSNNTGGARPPLNPLTPLTALMVVPIALAAFCHPA